MANLIKTFTDSRLDIQDTKEFSDAYMKRKAIQDGRTVSKELSIAGGVFMGNYPNAKYAGMSHKFVNGEFVKVR